MFGEIYPQEEYEFSRFVAVEQSIGTLNREWRKLVHSWTTQKNGYVLTARTKDEIVEMWIRLLDL